jgi:predicted nucleic acid-binding protein
VDSVFVDTSALVKYYYPEDGSEKVESILLKAKRIYLCQVATTEFASALMKKVRTGTLEMEAQILEWNAFLDDLNTGQMELVLLDERHYQKAAEIIRGYGQKDAIKTLDSLHLVAALDVPEAKFICADKFLSGIAVKMGLTVEKL